MRTGMVVEKIVDAGKVSWMRVILCVRVFGCPPAAAHAPCVGRQVHVFMSFANDCCASLFCVSRLIFIIPCWIFDIHFEITACRKYLIPDTCSLIPTSKFHPRHRRHTLICKIFFQIFKISRHGNHRCIICAIFEFGNKYVPAQIISK